LFKIYTI